MKVLQDGELLTVLQPMQIAAATGGYIARRTVFAMAEQQTVWAEYRAGWRRRPWLVPFAVVAVLAIAAAVVGTVRRDPASILFIPGLALLYLHHILVRRSAGQP